MINSMCVSEQLFSSISSYTPHRKTNMTMENQPFEDVFPIEKGDFPTFWRCISYWKWWLSICHVSFPGVYNVISYHRNEPRKVCVTEEEDGMWILEGDRVRGPSHMVDEQHPIKRTSWDGFKGHRVLWSLYYIYICNYYIKWWTILSINCPLAWN